MFGSKVLSKLLNKHRGWSKLQSALLHYTCEQLQDKEETCAIGIPRYKYIQQAIRDASCSIQVIAALPVSS